MGVIDRPLRGRREGPAHSIRVPEPDVNYSDEDIEILYQTSAAAAAAAAAASVAHPNRGGRRRRNVKKVKCNTNPQPADYPRCSGRKAQGSKVSRRMENLTFLLDLFGHEQLAEDEADRIYEPKFSAFAQLLSEKEKMKVWNQFINLGEDEQEALLNKSSLAATDVGNLTDAAHVEDKRSGHPSYSAPECFARIEHRLQQMLRRRHVPVGLVAALETDIRAFFKQQPTSKYVTHVESCYERLVVHAVCQYLDLLSRSFESEGRRKTQIKNKHPSFCPPDVTLCCFVESSSDSCEL